jgi:hypothetical protein
LPVSSAHAIKFNTDPTLVSGLDILVQVLAWRIDPQECSFALIVQIR